MEFFKYFFKSLDDCCQKNVDFGNFVYKNALETLQANPVPVFIAKTFLGALCFYAVCKYAYSYYINNWSIGAFQKKVKKEIEKYYEQFKSERDKARTSYENYKSEIREIEENKLEDLRVLSSSTSRTLRLSSSSRDTTQSLTGETLVPEITSVNEPSANYQNSYHTYNDIKLDIIGKSKEVYGNIREHLKLRRLAWLEIDRPFADFNYFMMFYPKIIIRLYQCNFDLAPTLRFFDYFLVDANTRKLVNARQEYVIKKMKLFKKARLEADFDSKNQRELLEWIDYHYRPIFRRLPPGTAAWEFHLSTQELSSYLKHLRVFVDWSMSTYDKLDERIEQVIHDLERPFSIDLLNTLEDDFHANLSSSSDYDSDTDSRSIINYPSD